MKSKQAKKQIIRSNWRIRLYYYLDFKHQFERLKAYFGIKEGS